MTNTFEDKFVVCPRCLGEGNFGPGLTETPEESDERWGSHPEDGIAFWKFVREGGMDVPCDYCHGQRVVVSARGEDTEEWRLTCEYEAEEAAERRAGC